MRNKEKLLVVIAHPDDEVLGCAGLLLHNHFIGGENYVLYLNNGCHYRRDFEESVIREQIDEVSKLLHFKPIVEKFKTGEFDTYPQRVVNDIVKSHILDIKPTTVVTHISNDLHKDHRIVNDAVKVACRFVSKSPVRNFYEMPVISSSEINPNFNFSPNLFLDITPYIEKKMEAMEKYVFEVESMEELRGAKGIEGWAIFYGMHIGVKYAEAFKVIRGVI
jgi:LmbE family N-acetylglucosaminyl deacetylase